MRKFSSAFINFISRIINRVPLFAQMAIGDFLGIVWFDLLRVRRGVALDNLRQCFPDWTESQRVKTARASVRHLGRSFVEFLRLPTAELDDYADHFDVKGIENLQDALNGGKGAFLLVSHIGNGDWVTLAFALNGMRLSSITKEFKWKALNDFWFRTRQRFGMDLIPDRKSSLTILKKLKQNEIVGFTLDQFLGPPIGIKTKFFGRDTGTPMGLAVLVGRSRAPVVPALTYRLKNGRTVLAFEPEIPYIDTGDKDRNIQVNTQRYCDKIEKWVREHPEQWMWVHRRWKEFRE